MTDLEVDWRLKMRRGQGDKGEKRAEEDKTKERGETNLKRSSFLRLLLAKGLFEGLSVRLVDRGQYLPVSSGRIGVDLSNTERGITLHEGSKQSHKQPTTNSVSALAKSRKMRR